MKKKEPPYFVREVGADLGEDPEEEGDDGEEQEEQKEKEEKK